MANLRFTDVQTRPTEFLDLTSVTLDEFQQLIPPFEAAFQAHMATWCLDGKPRTARQFSVYKNGTAEPLRVSPPEAAAYLVEGSRNLVNSGSSCAAPSGNCCLVTLRLLLRVPDRTS